MKKNFLFTSESVTEGHPDRLCDMISDAVVDRVLQQDPYSRIITECALSKGVVFMAARSATNANMDLPEVARSVIGSVGYSPEDFDASDCTVVTSLITMPSEQRFHADELEVSDAEISQMAVNNQATVFGYACNHTPEYMPLPIMLANRLARALTAARRRHAIPYLSPDCTVQVGIEFENSKPARIHGVTLIAGSQGRHQADPVQLREALIEHVTGPVFAGYVLQPDEETKIYINPRGAFPKSGPAHHSGMTGRKTASDTYGGFARHSGSALSGKDPSRIDRVGVYAARYAAKNVVAAGLAEECEVQLSYSIGYAAPVSVQVQTFGTGSISETSLKKRVEEHFDFRLGALIRNFNLRHLSGEHDRGFFGGLPSHGHFANDTLELPWEATDRVDALRP